MRIALLGSGGLLGRRLQMAAVEKGIDVLAASRAIVDAQDPAAVRAWVAQVAPDLIILNASHTGGVQANLAAPATMLADNARIALAGIGAAQALGVPRLLYCGSVIVYPNDAPQPYRETDAGGGAMDPTHLGYAAAKLLGMRYCEAVRQQDGLAYTTLLLGNMYGPGQRWDPARSNVVAGLMRRLHEAKGAGADEVAIWGTGRAARDLLYVGDAAEAVLAIATSPDQGHGLINVASGVEVTIAALAHTIAAVVGFDGRLMFDPSKPQGALRRTFDISRLAALGWRAETALEAGLQITYQDFLARLSASSAEGRSS